MSMTRAQIATQLLNEMAPKGEKLAYMNNREAELLKRMGGAGQDSSTGIKSILLVLVKTVSGRLSSTFVQGATSVMAEVAVMIIFHSQLCL
jgi:hypothetical protein